MDLKMSVPNSPRYAIWNSQSDKETYDIQVDAETSDGKETKKGKIMMVGGRVMATKGPITEPGYEIDALDSAVLEQILVIRLLGASMPNGPTEKGSQQIDFSNAKTGIQFATPSAQGFIAPPWKVKGEVRVLASDVVEYSLALTSGTKGKPADQGGEYSANFVGKLSKKATAKINDAMSLDGWNLYGVGVQTRKEGSATAYDYGAVPATTTYKTVADLRKKLAEDNNPGEPGPSKNSPVSGKKNAKTHSAFRSCLMAQRGNIPSFFVALGAVGSKAAMDGIHSLLKTRTTK